MKRECEYQCKLSFFGLTPTYRAELHKQLIDITYNSKGSITFEEVYRMPIWLRKFTYYELSDRIKKENEQSKPNTRPPKYPVYKPPVQHTKRPK